MKITRKLTNIHIWLALVNVVSLIFILQIVFEVIPVWECDYTDEKIDRINSFVLDLSIGVITSTFFYYLLVYYGEWKRSKGIRRLNQWRLNTMAANMQIVIGYYVNKYNIQCKDSKFLTAEPEAFKQIGNLTRDKIEYWYRWANSDSAMNVCGSSERGFVCNYIDMVKHHADSIMESTVFSLEETELMDLVSRIDRCELVKHIVMLNRNPKLDVYLGDYGHALMLFYQYYCELSSYVFMDDIIPKEDGCKLGVAFVYP